MKQIHKKLLSWYKEHGRHELPWRNTQDLYHIYLSEIMLQQTQVNRVRDEYYPQFLAKFPTLEALGEAPLDDVLAAWSGLGYYRRAKNLHATAQLTKNALPQSVKELKELPGIGAYTASAICCFALEQDVPVVDTNIARVLKRHYALLDVKEKTIWEKAEHLVNAKDPRHHNLALMDLGSMVCTPKNPQCSLCPLEESCQGKQEPESYTQTKKKEYISMELFFGAYIKNGKVALELSSNNMYKDMLVLPSVEPLEENLLGTFKHAYTKYRLSVSIYEVEEIEGDFVWLSPQEFASAPISSLTKKAERFLRKLI
jgi:A/G-specific adenine glycosylase